MELNKLPKKTGWKGNSISTKYSSLTDSQIVELTTSGEARDKNLAKMIGQ